MLTSSWPYLLRLALAGYFFFNHLPSVLKSFNYFTSLKNINLATPSIFTCASSYVAPEISFTVWHGLFVLLGICILIWPRPVVFISIATLALAIDIYFNLKMNMYGVSTLLMITTFLISIALLIIYGVRKKY